jgi:hypothetical protein
MTRSDFNRIELHRTGWKEFGKLVPAALDRMGIYPNQWLARCANPNDPAAKAEDVDPRPQDIRRLFLHHGYTPIIYIRDCQVLSARVP